MSPQPQLAPVSSLRDGPLGEPISPELVLVDPVLAERVRAMPEPSPSWRRLGVAPSPSPSPVVERPDDSPAPESPRVMEPGVAKPPSFQAPPAVATPPAATESDGVAVPIEANMVPAQPREAEPPRIVALEPPPSSEPPLVPRAVALSAATPVRLVSPPEAAAPVSLLRERAPAGPAATDAEIIPPTPAAPPVLPPERAPSVGDRHEPPAGRRFRVGHGTTLLAVGILAGLIGGVMAADAWMPREPTLQTVAPTSRDGGPTSADSTDDGAVASAPSVSGPKASTKGAAPKTAPTTSAKKPSAPKRAAPKAAAPKKAAARKPNAGRSKQAQPAKRATAAPVQSPAFVWVAVPGASRYEVVFERDGKVVYSATTRSTRLELPRSWRYDGKAYALERGRYHWTVWPIVDGNRGKPVVSSDYTA